MTSAAGVLFLNPKSGVLPEKERDELRAAAREAGLEVVEIEAGLDIPALIGARAAAGGTLFVVAGGDGSIHAVAQSLVGTDSILGVVPTGSLNHFARDLDLPPAWRDALAVAISGETRAIDVGRVNDSYFLNNLLIGIYAKISEYRERYREMGKWRAYIRAIRIALRRFRSVALVLETPDGVERVKTQMFTVSVGPDDLARFGFLAPRLGFRSGTLHVYWLPYLTRLSFTLTVARYFLGVATAFGDFRSLDTTRLTIHSRRRVQVATDGELSWMNPPLELSIVPGALKVRVPQKSPGGAPRRETSAPPG
ncbi:MAG: diacylglycerol kinase family protein [Acidobacteriota bacterium]